MPARRAAAVLRKAFSSAGHDERAAVGPELAEQDPCQLELPASHEAVDAEDFAGAHLERDVLEAAGEREPACLQHHRPIARRRQRDIVGVGLLEGLAALADHRFDQGSLAGRGRLRLGDLPAVAEDRHRVRDAQDVLDEMGNEDDSRCLRRAAVASVANRRSTSGGESAEVGSSRMMMRAPDEQHAGDLDQLLQADRQVAEPRKRIDIDAESGELFARFARHAPPLHQAKAVGRLRAEKHVLGHR